MKRTFEFTDDKASKFWSIEQNGVELTITSGKTGTAGQQQTKTLASEEACRKEAEKLVKEKTKKGYVEQSSNPTPVIESATRKEQKYIPIDVTDFDRIMSPMRWDSDMEEEVVSFIDYYEEYCNKPYALVDDKCLSLIWADPDDTDKKHTCTVTPASKTITLQPLERQKVTIELSDQLLATIQEEMESWDLTISPFTPVTEKKATISTKPKKMGTVKIHDNPNARAVPMPCNLKICIRHIQRDITWDITANYHITNGIYGSNTYKKKFATPQEAIIDLIKVAIAVSTYPAHELVYISDCEDDSKKYPLEDLTQLAYQYMQAKSPSNATQLELPVFDPEDDVAAYFEAIKAGDAAAVKEFLLAGANPTDCKMKNKTIYPLETAIKLKHADVATVLAEHHKALRKEVPAWMVEEIRAIS